jgi:hypothetical protein
MPEEKSLRVILNGANLEKYDAIKKYLAENLGLDKDSDIVRYCVAQTFKQLFEK